MIKVRPTYSKTNRPLRGNVGWTDKFYDREVNFCCSTNGNGHWSRFSKDILHKKISLVVTFHDPELKIPSMTELRVYFSKEDWDTEEHGLIYTDRQWIINLKSNFVKLGFSKSSLKKLVYSEQGMQGDDYVSMDVNDDFIEVYFENLYSEKEKNLGSFIVESWSL